MVARGNYIGVAKLRQKSGAYWTARMRKRDGSFRFSGRFETARGAAYEYDKMARFEFGAAATLNFPDDGTGLAANEEEEVDQSAVQVAVGRHRAHPVDYHTPRPRGRPHIATPIL